MGKGKKYSYGHGGGMMGSMMMPKKMVMKDGGQALFDALKKKGYKKMGGQTESMLTKMTKGGMMDMSAPAQDKMRYGGPSTEKIKMMGGSMKKKMQDGGKVMFVKTKDAKDAPIPGMSQVTGGRMMKEKKAKRKESKGKGYIAQKYGYGGSTYGKKKDS